MLYHYVLPVLATSFSLSYAASTFSPARPPAIPLAVKSPYVNCWQQAGSDSESGGPGNGGYLAGQWPTFWAGQILGWAGLIRVDGTSYTWMGAPAPFPTVVNQTSFEYTSTRSTFIMDIGGLIEMNITFLSPLYPTDMMRQSLLFSYLDVIISSSDGDAHDVQLYADITAEWVSGDRSAIAEWEYGITPNDSIAYHQIYKQTQLLWSENDQQTEYGDWYWATDNVPNLTFESGFADDIREAFITSGDLGNTNDTNYRAISDSYPTFGFAVNLGSVESTAVSTLFTLGLTQEQAIQFDGANGNVSVPSLWTSYFATELDALTFFHADYANAAGLATSFDNQIAGDANAAGGENYVTITSLAARQAFGATQLCGTPDTPYLFLKEISSDGNIQTLLLDPLFINQESGQYPHQWSMHDLGASYPNATGHALGNDEQQPIEECGNMLIMTLAYAQKASDTAYLSQNYAILDQWTQYLIENTLIPGDQLSTDDFAGPLANQTDLALKGIIGIGAMASIANLTGNTNAASNYSSIAHDYITQWQTLGIAMGADPPHTTLAYGMNDTYSILYNLYGDRELNLGLVPQSIYDMQSNFYPTVFQEYGVPLDTRANYADLNWQMYVASIAAQDTTAMFISAIATWINESPTNRALTDLYDATSGDYASSALEFTARPAVGGVFSLLALTST